jgi:hypothetical protein
MFRLLALLLLATGLLIPRGIMPVRDAHGVLQVTLCTGYGPVKTTIVIPMAPDGHDQDKAPADKHATACPFAAQTGPLLTPSECRAPLPSLADAPAPAALASRQIVPGRGMAAPPPPSQAPPATLI